MQIFRLFVVTTFFVLLAGVLSGGTIPRSEYISYIELANPRIVEQTPANKFFNLFGERGLPEFKDLNPIDGMDDDRYALLHRLGVKFAPYMILNTFLVPMDLRKFIYEPHHPLHVDTWDISSDKARIIESETVNFHQLGNKCNLLQNKIQDSSDSIGMDETAFVENADCKFISLLNEYDPYDPGRTMIRDRRDPTFLKFKVFFFDFPGEDELTWKEAFSNSFSNSLKRKYQFYITTFTHPFVHAVRSKYDNSLLGYEFLIQYWFFYPYNDGGNDHEGDWEHINVVISPMDKVQKLLNENDIRNILAGKGLHDSPIHRYKVTQEEWNSQLVIKRVEYFFHYKVMMMNYADPNVYASRATWEQEVDRAEIDRIGENWIDKKIRERAYITKEENEINTHPLVYVGGDDKGNDQLLAKPGGKNRDSHGSYPFTGLYKDVGPAGATELITRTFNYTDYLSSLDSLQEATSKIFVKRGSVVPLNKPERICIVPDWEVIYPYLRTNPLIRRDWGWLMFPIHWGYPASISPFAGVVKHADTGNISPVTPTYTVGWNQSANNSRYHLYYPHKLSSFFPLTIEDSYMNDLGYLNLTLPLLSNVPPFDFAWRVVAAPFRAALKTTVPTFYTRENIPFRFVGFAGGVDYQIFPEEYFALLFHPEQYVDIYNNVIELDPALDSVSTNIEIDVKNSFAPKFGVNLYLGKHFVTENAIRHSRSEIAVDISLTNRPEPYKLRADMNFWEYIGSLRYNITTGNFLLYLKTGYGISFYRVENIRGDGQKIEHPNTPWVRRPTWHKLYNLLPNTTHFGWGFEFIPFKSYGNFPKSIDIGLRLEYLWFNNKLGLDFGDVLEFGDFKLGLDDITVNRSVINFVLTVNF